MQTLQTLMCFERNADWNGRTIWSCATNLWHPLKRARPVLHYPTQLRGSGHLCKVWKTSNIGDFWPLRNIKKAFFSVDLWLIISVALLILFQASKMKVCIYYIKLHVHGVKAHGISGKKALSGNWEELHNETCKQCIFTCVQNNFKVYFCTQIWTNKIALLPEDICLVKNNPLTFLHNFDSLVPNQI